MVEDVADWNLIEAFYKDFYREKERQEGDPDGVFCLNCKVNAEKINTERCYSSHRDMRGTLCSVWYEWTFKCPNCGRKGVEKQTEEDQESYKSPYS